MAMTKQAHDEALQKIAAIDERDANNAYELGFAQACEAMGLDNDQYVAFRKIAVEQLEKVAEAAKPAETPATK